MVTSQQQWRQRSFVLLMAALALVLLVGSAEATCKKCYGDCDGNPYNGCETNICTSYSHCGSCSHSCYPGEYCSGGYCLKKVKSSHYCPKGYYYDSYQKRCVHS